MDKDKTTEISDIRAWMAHPITGIVWIRLKEMGIDGDLLCHEALKKGEMHEAANWNAYCDAVKELMRVPEEMIEEIKDEKV